MESNFWQSRSFARRDALGFALTGEARREALPPQEVASLVGLPVETVRSVMYDFVTPAKQLAAEHQITKCEVRSIKRYARWGV